LSQSRHAVSQVPTASCPREQKRIDDKVAGGMTNQLRQTPQVSQFIFVYFVFIKEAIGTRDSMNLPRSSAQALSIIRFFKKTFYCYIVYLEKHYSNV
jgi:hypothetical protein